MENLVACLELTIERADAGVAFVAPDADWEESSERPRSVRLLVSRDLFALVKGALDRRLAELDRESGSPSLEESR